MNLRIFKVQMIDCMHTSQGPAPSHHGPPPWPHQPWTSQLRPPPPHPLPPSHHLPSLPSALNDTHIEPLDPKGTRHRVAKLIFSCMHTQTAPQFTPSSRWVQGCRPSSHARITVLMGHLVCPPPSPTRVNWDRSCVTAESRAKSLASQLRCSFSNPHYHLELNLKHKRVSPVHCERLCQHPPVIAAGIGRVQQHAQLTAYVRG